MSEFIDKLKYRFQTGDMLMKLIYINVAVFLAVNIIHLLFWMTGAHGFDFDTILAVPTDLHKLLFRPWTIITYMFYHEGFFHILFNMIVLYFAGQIFLEFLGERRLLNTYLAGGIAGAFLYILTYNLLPQLSSMKHVSVALGASASIMAILIGVATYTPNYSIRLMFIGNVKLKWIAIFYIVIDLISIPHGDNTGGHIAHIGGALYGFLYIIQLQRGRDWSDYFSGFFLKLKATFQSKPKMKVKHKDTGNTTKKKENKREQQASQAKIDSILDKISKTGYESLTKKEKDELFRASKDS